MLGSLHFGTSLLHLLSLRVANPSPQEFTAPSERSCLHLLLPGCPCYSKIRNPGPSFPGGHQSSWAAVAVGTPCRPHGLVTLPVFSLRSLNSGSAKHSFFLAAQLFTLHLWLHCKLLQQGADPGTLLTGMSQQDGSSSPALDIPVV